MHLNGQIFSDPTALADGFNDYFTSFNTVSPNINGITFSEQNSKSLFLQPVTPSEVSDIIRKTTLKSSAGFDELPGAALKHVQDIISVPFSYIINESFNNGCFPQQLKVSKCIPIFKNKGAREEIGNYRNICLQSQLSKVIEMAFKSRLCKFIENNNYLSTNQHGFRTGKSTNTALNSLTEMIYQALNNREQSLGIFFDLSRAFDMVNHDVLLRKLIRIGVRGITNKWIETYLHDRKQVIYLNNGRTSGMKQISSGVPQGSILGPVLFLIFVNDIEISCAPSCSIVMYADDMTFLVRNKNQKTAAEDAQKAIKKFEDYCRNNGLMVNTTKSKFMSFVPKNYSKNHDLVLKLENKLIEHIDHFKFLGITIDQKMIFCHQVDNIVSKLSCHAFLFRQIRTTVSKNVIRMMYFGLVESILSYGLIYWGASSHIDRVFILQKK